jgi:hypothetical protein
MRRWLSLAILPFALVSAGAGSARERARPSPLPSRAEARAVCNFVAARGPAIRALLVRDGVLDANNDGVPDAVTVGMGTGTMRGDVLEFRPRGAAKDSPAVKIAEEGFQGGDYLPFGGRWLRHGGRVYTVNFETESLRHVSYLSYIDPNNTERLVCDFTNVERESLRPTAGRDADQLCRAVAQQQVSYVATIEEQDPSPDLAPERRETHVAGRITVDFRNADAPAPLALLSYESGAGRGCDLSYFDVITEGRVASSGDAHALLMTLQDVEPEVGRTAGPCDGRTPRWFTHRGLVYLDIATKPDGLGAEPFHEVKRVREKRAETLCKGAFQVQWKVKSMGQDFQ